MKVKVTKAPPYVRLFDEKAAGWTRNPESNRHFLLLQQAYANEKLKAKGYLFLNEVLDILGIPIVPMGQIVGWICDVENVTGDNYIDFGLCDTQRKGPNGETVLNFNVDGYIMDKI